MDKLKTIVQTLDSKLGKDIVVMDMSLNSPLCDYFVIVTASNERLMQSLKDYVEEECDKKGYFVKSIEGRKNSKWILMDYGDIVVHIFDPEERKNYSIEKLWSDQPTLNVEDLL
ncbi:ribosome silencing factor [[Clostridium] spiroforme]|nr:ribosome silencing factor [Thomasclavelia spiroformis]MBM6879789.1 ribosome silencing factor [Thomasclavelia spiroformis]MBM6930576.1 ribosome silencing factor [Thomasclavelia spiroformis]